MWLWIGIVASIFCLLASAGLTIISWSESGPGLVVFALLTLFWAQMFFTLLRQARKPATEPAREPIGSPTVFVPHWFLMGAILLTALLVCLAIIAPLLAK